MQTTRISNPTVRSLIIPFFNTKNLLFNLFQLFHLMLAFCRNTPPFPRVYQRHNHDHSAFDTTIWLDLLEATNVTASSITCNIIFKKIFQYPAYFMKKIYIFHAVSFFH